MKNSVYPLYDLPKIVNIEDMLRQRATDHHGKTAFTFRKGKSIQTKTFDEVYQEVRQLRYWLLSRYPTGSHIAVLGENSYEWLLVFLSIITSGNVAVPIDKELTSNEVAELVDHADVSVFFCSATYDDLVESVQGAEIISLKQIANLLKEVPPDLPCKLELNDESLSCIFFTSGTSGKPKGVMLSHGNLTAEINETCKLFKLEGDTLSVLPFHHAFGLIVGVLMVYNYGFNNFINKSLKHITKDLAEAKPQTMFLVPLFVETFYRQIRSGIKKSGKEATFNRIKKFSDMLLRVGFDIRRKCFSEITAVFGGNLQYVISGGASLDPMYIREFRSMGVEILNGYGTTECSPCTAVNRNRYHRDGTVGVMVPNTEAKISEDGEVLISGPHVMQGYYKDEAGTREVLVNGWYHTGDLGTIDRDGFISLTGRKKNLIILSNGENVSPEELEGNLSVDPAVIEVLVYERSGQIVAEIYPEEGYMGNKEYFDALIQKVNSGRPVYKRIASCRLRDKEFLKNSSKKIIRHLNISEG